jgi:hypothetical protein
MRFNKNIGPWNVEVEVRADDDAVTIHLTETRSGDALTLIPSKDECAWLAHAIDRHRRPPVPDELRLLREATDRANHNAAVLKDAYDDALKANEKANQWLFAVHRELNVRPGDFEGLKRLAAKLATPPLGFTP